MTVLSALQWPLTCGELGAQHLCCGGLCTRATPRCKQVLGGDLAGPGRPGRAVLMLWGRVHISVVQSPDLPVLLALPAEIWLRCCAARHLPTFPLGVVPVITLGPPS